MAGPRVANTPVRVGFLQFAPRFGRVAENLKRVCAALRRASADLVVLPELAFTGYFFRDRRQALDLAEDPAASPTIASLAALCRERGFGLVTGFAEKRGDKVFNSALLIEGDGVAHTYRKLHLFDREKEWFDPGDRALETVAWRGLHLGLMVCFDWAFPEVARILALQGADLLCHPSNLVLAHCQQAMLTRCLENGVFAVTANRCGSETRGGTTLTFTGRSQVAGPRGELLHRARADGEEVFVTPLDVLQARDKTLTAHNDRWTDRRPEHYGFLVSGGASRAFQEDA